MPKRYSHTQTGYPALVGLIFTLAFGFYLSSKSKLPDSWVIPAVILFSVVWFISLTIEIDDNCLEIKFWPGILPKRYPLAEIASCRATKTGWAWGIHWTHQGWLYNVSGFDGVEITTRTGRVYLVGSDEPEKLASALREAAKLEG